MSVLFQAENVHDDVANLNYIQQNYAISLEILNLSDANWTACKKKYLNINWQSVTSLLLIYSPLSPSD